LNRKIKFGILSEWQFNHIAQLAQLAQLEQGTDGMALESAFPVGAHLTKPRLVFGCGNPLFGDDGFGAAVIEHLLSHYALPEDTACLDVGTAIRDFLFDMLLSTQKPRQLIIVDAMDLLDAKPGDIREIDIAQIHPSKVCDFSLHQFPTTNMLQELKEGTTIQTRILVAQTSALPEEVRPGLSPLVRKAVPVMCDRIMEIIDWEKP
jgi:coenzyme F420 hydrogenase subunit delta